MDIRSELTQRFFRYLAVESQSDARSTSLPSTQGQQRLAALLASELQELGLDNIVLDDHATVTAVRRGTRMDSPKIGFIAHLDTADVGLSAIIRPQVLRFEGVDICLNAKDDIWLRTAEHPEIMPWSGHDIIFSNGTSVLGADNKAAIAVIMTLLARLPPDRDHGDIHIAFAPDEEIGMRGAKALDLARFACDFAYTIDCCELGEVVLETFNAATADIVFSGVSVHPMSAYGVMVNPLLMATDFIAGFDRNDTPERTKGRQGFFWFKELTSNDQEARLTVLIRDFDEDGLLKRKECLREAVRLAAAHYPSAKVSCVITDTYANIGQSMKADTRPAERLLAAMKALEIAPKIVPMRGGTDGSVLSARGIPTPNVFTGAYNFHSRFEFLPLDAFEKSYQTARLLCLS
ncbi:peptidase T [Chelatococcus asaccharovorans]|uniref:peptidase T n=1 Tax=Chelatococcus asaccharovorans TaxID=28210 RepID=UPI00224C7871|nr:peptidase T [Chelatococcus asaccharovorans]CAH1672766.1 Tripeptide aminopeptidase [Chelatococcus asaccharovorans]CAH1675835.1 Tripeptide aminopeptidase [Chelatococcus asaccharovorans]